MANSALMTRKGTIAPALVIGTFEKDVTTGEMASLAKRMMLIELEDVSRESTLAVSNMFENVQCTPGRRRVLPEDLTGGRRVYAFDLMMIGDYLPTDTLEAPLIPSVAEPGESETIQMIPWSIAARKARDATRDAARRGRDATR